MLWVAQKGWKRKDYENKMRQGRVECKDVRTRYMAMLQVRAK